VTHTFVFFLKVSLFAWSKELFTKLSYLRQFAVGILIAIPSLQIQAANWPQNWAAAPQLATRYSARLQAATWTSWGVSGSDYLHLQISSRQVWFFGGMLTVPLSATVILHPGPDFSLKAGIAQVSAPTPVFSASVGAAHRLGATAGWVFADWYLTQEISTFRLRQLNVGIGWSGMKGKYTWSYSAAGTWFSWLTQGNAVTGFSQIIGGKITRPLGKRWDLAIAINLTLYGAMVGIGANLHLP